MNALSRLLGASGITLALAVVARSQTVLLEVVGSEPGAELGAEVVLLDDLDGDGAREWAVGAPGALVGGAPTGTVQVHTGTAPSPMYELEGRSLHARFGHSIASVGDVDQDGVPDLLVGAPGEDLVQLFSGVDGEWIRDLSNGLVDTQFGRAVSGAGDVDLDGIEDHLVGAPEVGAQNDGRAYCFAGSDGSLLWSAVGHSWGYGRTGSSVAAVGDVNGDGRSDVLVGARVAGAGTEGEAYVLSGPSGALLRFRLGATFEGELGFSACGLGDVDGDGVGDYAVGSRAYLGLHPNGDPSVQAFSGASGVLLAEFFGPEGSWFAYKIAAAGDVDLDGVEDLAVSTAGFSNDPALSVFSVARGVELFDFDASTLGLGLGLGAGGDVDGDGYADFLLGNPWDDSLGQDAGAYVLLGGPCWPDAAYPYCTGAPNSAGAGASMGHQGSLSVASDDLRLAGFDCPTGQWGIFYYGPQPAEVSFGEGLRCVGAPFVRFPPVMTGATGNASYQVDYSNLPGGGAIEAGSTWFFQFWYRDSNGGPAGFNLSDGLRGSFCP